MQLERSIEVKLSTISSRALAGTALLLVAPALAWAQDGDLAIRLVDAGWKQMETNVFQRYLEDGTVETVGWGLEAVAWELDRVRERIAELEALHLELEEPSLELMDALSQYQSRALELQAELDGEWETPIPRRLHGGELHSLAGALGCNSVFDIDVAAYPTLTGPAARARVSFSDPCGTYAQVMVAATASGLYNGVFHSAYDSDPGTGRRSGYGSVSASAFASVVATSQCSSEAVARLWVEDGNGNLVLFVKRATNSVCRVVFPDPGDCLTNLAPCTIP